MGLGQRLREILTRKNFLKVAAGGIGILFLVPAMVAVNLYPTSWVLDIIQFQIGSMKIAEFRWLIVIFIAATAALFFVRPHELSTSLETRARQERLPNIWVMLALLSSGLLLLPVDRMGIGVPEPTKWEGYPSDYSSTDARARLKKIEHPDTVNERLGFLRQLYDWMYSPPLQTKRAQTSIALADFAIEHLKTPSTTNSQRIANRHASVGYEIKEYWQFPSKCTPTETVQECTKTIRLRLAELIQEGKFLGDLSVASTPPKKFELAAAAAAAVKVELETLERQIEERIAFVRSVPYVIAASIAFILTMYVVGFRSFMLALLLFATLGATAWSVWPVDLSEWTDWFIIFYPTFVGGTAGFLWRFLFRAYQDNREVLRGIKLSKPLLVGFAVRVLIAALPFYGLVYFAHFVGQAGYEEFADAIYCESSFFDCGSTRRLVYDSDPTRDSLRDDINAGVQRLFLAFEAQAINAAGDAPKLTSAAIADATKRIMALFDDVLRPNIYDNYPDLKPPSRCRWFLPDFKCFARKIALERLNAAYQAPRNRLRANVQSTLDGFGIKISQGVSIAAAEVKEKIQHQAKVATRNVVRTVDASFITLSAFAIAQMAFALLIVMRALLLISGRTLYGESRPRPTNERRRGLRNLANARPSWFTWVTPLRWPNIEQRLERVSFPLTHAEAKPETAPTVELFKEEFELSNGSNLPLLVKRKYDVDDAYKATALVRSRYHQWPLRRMLNGCLILRWAWCEEGKEAIRFSGPAGSRFVVWQIPAECEVFFRWNEFVAMSASATLKKTISLRFGSLMTGTVMLPSVVGPGILIQVNRGITEVAKIEKVPPSIYPHRLISWEAGTEFRIRSPRGILSLYCDPPSLEPAKKALAVIDTDGGSSHGVGVLKELFRLVRP